jgi:hypothetical protein
MSANADSGAGRTRRLLVAGVLLLAVATLVLVSRQRRERAREHASAAPEAPLKSNASEDAQRSARTCRVRLSFADGEPAEGVAFHVESRPADDAPYELVGRGLTNSDGSFLVRLYENWRQGRAVRLVLSDGEQLAVDPQEFDLASGALLEVEVTGARVSLEVVNRRGDPLRERTVYYENADSSGEATGMAQRFGTTDRLGRVRRDFGASTTIVAFAVNSSGARCTDRVALAMQPGIAANRATLTGPGALPSGGLYVTVVDELDRPLERALVRLSRGEKELESDWSSNSVRVFEHLEPGEYVLHALPLLGEAEREDLQSPNYVAARVKVQVGETIEDVRVPLARAAVLVLDVSRTGEWSDLRAYLRVPGADDFSVPVADVGPLLLRQRGFSWARFVDATGRDRTEEGTFPGSFRDPGRYWCLAPPGTFEVVFFESGDRRTRFPRGPVELTSERETTLTVEL